MKEFSRGRGADQRCEQTSNAETSLRISCIFLSAALARNAGSPLGNHDVDGKGDASVFRPSTERGICNGNRRNDDSRIRRERRQANRERLLPVDRLDVIPAIGDPSLRHKEYSSYIPENLIRKRSRDALSFAADAALMESE